MRIKIIASVTALFGLLILIFVINFNKERCRGRGSVFLNLITKSSTVPTNFEKIQIQIGGDKISYQGTEIAKFQSDFRKSIKQGERGIANKDYRLRYKNGELKIWSSGELDCFQIEKLVGFGNIYIIRVYPSGWGGGSIMPFTWPFEATGS